MDERLKKESLLKKILKKPEFPPVLGAVVIFVIFFFLASGDMFSLEGSLSWIEQAALIGILAVGVCLLMIAGEFDLSIGSMIGFSGMMMAILIVEYKMNVSLAIILTFLVSMLIGFINGYLVIKTKLPSFIVTLGSLFILRGLTVALSRLLTNQTLVSGVNEYSSESWFAAFFGGETFTEVFSFLAKHQLITTYPDGTPVVSGIKMVIVWWIGLSILGVILLRLTKYGNWIYATGGDEQASKNMGVPTNKVKIALFMLTAFCASVFAACQVFDYGSADAQRGLLKEFEAIIAVVMGGALLTGGYGTVIGAFLGALIFGVVNIGISYTSIDSDYFRVFLGCMLLIAVIFSDSIRKKIMRQ
ncbi:ABC transporter permease [Campylobacter sp. MIT 21-1685]|uniref:ABC transporter permease n=1 Tax=unclassified Campylobacter TaxID=2593542 RepID=UPI00224A5F38|nr:MULTISPECIES: ABC transporter permease [unclassified Campylobacter]MCX2682506.1 ABC transporter permease [Campylobacter sp. MIT 21-1684]MCX2750781.1 ABC transporter permease [Campylobacter sp. MIT 21-1682]MCX2806987.1 ABC transporter permease [Campylobacter sp. MIT 21-1685]